MGDRIRPSSWDDDIGWDRRHEVLFRTIIPSKPERPNCSRAYVVDRYVIAELATNLCDKDQAGRGSRL